MGFWFRVYGLWFQAVSLNKIEVNDVRVLFNNHKLPASNLFMPVEICKYAKGTVVERPTLCLHSTVYFKGSPEVFDPKARPG